MPDRHPRIPLEINLRRVLPNASFVGCADIRVRHVTHSSRECRPNSLFAALRGHTHDGHHFIRDAVERGASAVLVEYPQSDVAALQCVVPDTRRSYAEICSALQGSPSRNLNLVGVTGTNGKTTTTWITRSILQAAGLQTGILGTIEYHDGVDSSKSTLTTPDAQVLAQWLMSMVSHRTTHAAMELSSHALDQGRIAGTMIDAAIITNITQDHLDYHLTYDDYRASKLKVISHLKSNGIVVLNADDPGSISCLAECCGRAVTFGIHNPADVSGTILEQSSCGTRFAVTVDGQTETLHTPLPGEHNVSNCLASIAAALHAGVSMSSIVSGIKSLQEVPGRLEPVGSGQPFQVYVDYAHTDDALRRSIAAVREFTTGRVICVFGAGGDRDRTKRPLLGRAGSVADLAVITSDNPRSEDPAEIIDEILTGMTDCSQQPHVEIEREEAIRWAIGQARQGDAVLVAGKGHETEQIRGKQRVHFDDREVVREVLARHDGLLVEEQNLEMLRHRSAEQLA